MLHKTPGDFPRNCPFPLKDPGPHLIHATLRPPEYTSLTSSQSVQPFLHSLWLSPTDTLGCHQQTHWQATYVTIGCTHTHVHECDLCRVAGNTVWNVSSRSGVATLQTAIHLLLTYLLTHTFNSPLSGTIQVSRYQKGKTNVDFTEARDSEWQWHQLGHMQVCTSLQTPRKSQFFTDRMPFLPPSQQCQSTEGKILFSILGTNWRKPQWTCRQRGRHSRYCR